ncbi:isochorismatase family protein [Frankia sp. AiPs1]|uniref:cysteine hydrolase family protein n=1 Tax=Frankia sp. AiPs1 TaxID=573493 RepID=UPI002044C49E|nr:isochorismatase family protein [Frankia sp. AiPs1]MCM3921613.1 isochorismatase family protein [Frankia sp. AiPs1]
MSEVTGDGAAVDPSGWALLTIDVQNDFVRADGPGTIAGTETLLPAMARAAGGFRAAGLPVFHLVRLYLPDGSNAERCRRASIAAGRRLVCPGSDGSQLHPALAPPGGGLRLDYRALLAGATQRLGPQEWALFKPRWGGFYATRLADELRTLGVGTVVVVGANFPNCPRTTVYEASERDFEVVVVADAISRIYPRALAECRDIGARVLDTGELLAALGPAAGTAATARPVG